MRDLRPPVPSGFDSPALYRIGVQGRIPQKWHDRLEGMAVTEWSAANAPPMTTLVGELTDQASLAGVLDTLYELHLSVLSVERLS